MKKILVVRYRFIGDMVLTVPFLRNLRYAYPDAQIDILVEKISAQVIKNCPYVSNFINYEKKSFWKTVFELRKEKYDKVYVLKRSLSSALLCFFSGIRERIGYDTEGRAFLLTKKVKYDKRKHESLCFLDALKADGIEVKDEYLENWTDRESEEKIQRLFEEKGISEEIKKAVVNVTATNPGKIWNINNYIKIIEYLSNRKGVQVFFIGAPNDKKIYDEIKYSEELTIKPVNLCGEVNLQDSLVLLKKADVMIGNDSGNLHMASSVGTRVIGIYGPMPFEKWCAIGNSNILLKADLDCMPCSASIKCKRNHACMTSITVDMVKDAIDKIL